MRESLSAIQSQPISRRTIVRSGVRLAYAAPLIIASFSLAPLRAGALDALSSDQALEAAEQAAATNEQPVAVPGNDFDVVDADGDGFETVTVDGSASADPDGTIVSYLWTLPDEGDVWVSNDAVTTVTLSVGEHRLLLTVTDNEGARGARSIRIHVLAGEPAQEPAPVEEDTTTVDEAPILPPAPYDLQATQKFAEVALKWKVSSGTPAPFRVYRTVDDGLNRPLDELGWGLIWEEWQKLSYRDVAVEPGVPYLYVVHSFDGINESERSNVAAITLAPVEQPVEEAPVEEQIVEEAPVVEQSAIEDESVDELPVEEDPVVEDESVDEAPTEETS